MRGFFMKYIMSCSENSNKVTIMDVQRPAEKLKGDLGSKIGDVVNVMTTSEKLLKRINKMLRSKKSISKFEIDDNNLLYIDWIESEGENFKEHEDIIDISSVKDFELRKSLLTIASKFAKNKKKHREGVAKRKDKYAKKDSLFYRCHSIILEYTRKGRINKNLSEKSAAELYRYMVDNRDMLVGRLMFPYSKRAKDSENLKFGLILTEAILMIANIGALMSSFKFVNALAVFGVGLTTIGYTGVVCNRNKNNWHNELYTHVLKDLRSAYNLDYSKALEIIKEVDMRPEGLVDFIDKDLSYLKLNKLENAEDVRRLQELADCYSASYHEDVYGLAKLDKFEYADKLVDVEIDMYSKNPRFGRMIASGPKVNIDTLYQRLKFLGWDDRAVRSDIFLKTIISIIDSIIIKPYEGCEVEIMSLIKIAQKYVSSGGLYSSKGKHEEKMALLADLRDERNHVASSALYKLNRAEELELLAREALEEERKSIAIKEPAEIITYREKRIDLHN